MQRVFLSYNEDDTAALAQRVALVARKGDVWGLSGTLGAGKSVFARAFIQKLVPVSEVPSPTFTLVQSYMAEKFEIFHYDLYRLENPAEIFELGVEQSFFSGVNLVEWPEKMGSFAPRDMWQIAIEVKDSVRQITIYAPTEEKEKRLADI